MREFISDNQKSNNREPENHFQNDLSSSGLSFIPPESNIKPFIDKRPESAIQRKRQEMVDQSPQVQNGKLLQTMIDKSPHLIAERERFTQVFGGEGIKVSNYGKDNKKNQGCFKSGINFLDNVKENLLTKEPWHQVLNQKDVGKPLIQLKEEESNNQKQENGSTERILNSSNNSESEKNVKVTTKTFNNLTERPIEKDESGEILFNLSCKLIKEIRTDIGNPHELLNYWKDGSSLYSSNLQTMKKISDLKFSNQGSNTEKNEIYNLSNLDLRKFQDPSKINLSPFVQKLMDHTLISEGGYVNNSEDPGGATKYSIAEKREWPAAAKFLNLNSNSENIKNITRDQAQSYYIATRIEPYRINDLKGEKLAKAILDQSVLTPGIINKNIKRALNDLGNKFPENNTKLSDGEILAINNSNQIKLLECFLEHQLKHFESIKISNPINYNKHIKGWKNRLNGLK